MTTVRAHVLLRGRVQGVSFRYYTLREAERLGVSGWVRNLWDGRVEALFEGDEQAVKAAVEWCRHGPSSANVEDLDLRWETPTGEFSGFRVRMNGRGPV